MPQPHRRRSAIDVALLAILLALLFAVVARRVDRPGHSAHLEAGTLLVADLRGHALTIIDLPSGHTRSIALNGGPHELLRLPNGRVVASLEQAGALALIDVRTGAIEVLAIGGLPHGLALEGDNGAILVVTDRAAHALRRFEVESWRELPSTPAGDLPHALVQYRGAPLVANAAASMLALVGTLVPQPALTESIALSPGGDRVAVAGAADGRVLAYTAEGAPLFDVALGGRPVRLAFSPDGRTLAVALSASSQVALLDEAGAASYIDVPGVPDGLAFDAGGRILFTSNIAGGDITAIEVATGRLLASYDAGRSAGALLLLD